MALAGQRQRGGRAPVNHLSIAGRQPRRDYVLFCVVKTALYSFTLGFLAATFASGLWEGPAVAFPLVSGGLALALSIYYAREVCLAAGARP